MSLGGGDQLARGQAKASFSAGGSKMSDAQWAALWEKSDEPKTDSGNADVQAAGDAGAGTPELNDSDCEDSDCECHGWF